VQSIDQVAKRSIDRFHSQLNAEKYSEIYREAHPNMKSSQTESDFVAYLSHIHRLYGNFKRTIDSTSSFSRFVHTRDFGFRQSSGTAMIGLDSVFERGVCMEVFEWQVENGRAILVDYKCGSSTPLAEH
jgi:hypothetical protein